jgi:hypothetical protein
MSKINRNKTGLWILILCASIVASMGTPAQAGAQALSSDYQRNTDEFFNDPNNFLLSNCDKPTWNIVHQAAYAAYAKNLPQSSAEDDVARASQINKCIEKADQVRRELILDLAKLVHDNGKKIAALGSGAGTEINVLTYLDLTSNATQQTNSLESYMTQDTILTFEENAERLYMDHAGETRYRSLVERYNALANSLANVRLAEGSRFPIQPRPLHCDERTNTVTHVTQMDCQ